VLPTISTGFAVFAVNGPVYWSVSTPGQVTQILEAQVQIRPKYPSVSGIPHACQVAGNATKIAEIYTPAFKFRLEVNRDVSISAILSWSVECGHRVSHCRHRRPPWPTTWRNK
jgi:hypothetical protein